MKNKSKTTSKGGSTASSGSIGVSDDASTTDVRSGSSALIHGVVVDGLRRSAPTSLSSYWTRDALMRYANGDIAWYDPTSTDSSTAGTADTVANRLSVSVNDANAWKYGTSSDMEGSRFRRYADVPLNSDYLARLNFWAQVPDAAELDPSFQLEPQQFAIDEFSKMFSESCVFHFGFLMDLDHEYHRLRNGGPVGIFNLSNQHSPWYNAYHYYRDLIEATYLNGTHKVTLPEGAQNGNWRIVDVLHEIMRLMAPDGSNLLPDIRLSTKGVLNGQKGVALGLQSGEGYLDADGNSRFYFPWIDAAEFRNTDNFSKANTPYITQDVKLGDDDISQRALTIDRGTGNTSSDEILNTPTPVSETAFSAATPSFVTDAVDNAYALGVNALASVQNVPSPFLEEGYAGHTPSNTDWASSASVVEMARLWTATDLSDELALDTDLSVIRNLPTTGNGVVGRYWTGHNLNLVQLIGVARRIGRALEPEVSELILPSFGAVTNVSDLMGRGTGPSVRQFNDLYNLYSGKFSFNENPSRTYSAAHLGPSSRKIALDEEFTLEGITLHTEKGGKLLSARQKYWTPSTLAPGSQELTSIFGSLLAGTRFEIGLFDEMDMANDFPQVSTLDLDLVSRLLGTNSSMYTKVEKPVLLPAGKAAAEAVYASGQGIGTLQLLSELVLSVVGGVPKFGLGHSGFSDLYADSVGLAARADAAGHSEAVVLQGGVYASDVINALDEATPYSFASTLKSSPDKVAISKDLGSSNAVWTNSALGPSTTVMKGSPLTGEFLPRVVVAGTGTGIVQSTMIQKSFLSHRDQWGYLTFNDSTYGSGGSSPSAAFNTGTGTGFMVRPVVIRITGADEEGNSVTTTMDAKIDPYAHFFDSIPYVRGHGQTGLSLGVSVHGEPIMTMPSGDSSLRVHSGTGMDDGGFFPWIPSATPQDLIATALEYAYVHEDIVLPHGLKESLSSDDGTLQVEIDFDLRMGSNFASTATETASGWHWDIPWEGGTNKWSNQYGAGETVGTCTNEYALHLNVKPKDAEEDWHWRAIADVSTDATIDYTVGGQDDLGIVTTDLSNAVLQYKRTSNSQLNLTDLYTHETGRTEFPAAHALGTNNVGNFIGVRPPVFEDKFISSVEGKLMTIPDVKTLSPGKIEFKELELTFDSFWFTSQRQFSEDHGPKEFGASFSDPAWYTHNKEAPNTTNVRGVLTGNTTLSDNVGWMEYGIENPNVAQVKTASPVSSLANRVGSYAVISELYSARSSANVPRSLIPARRALQALPIYPDDPEHKMLYRPWRVIVDAAVAKELRYTFLNLGDDPDFMAGDLGISIIGNPKDFRFEELVEAGQQNVFILEKASSKTRMVNPDHRSILTFSRVSLLDPSSLRHTIADAARIFNAQSELRGLAYASSPKGLVYNRDLIRQVQAGRQRNRQQ